MTNLGEKTPDNLSSESEGMETEGPLENIREKLIEFIEGILEGDRTNEAQKLKSEYAMESLAAINEMAGNPALKAKILTLQAANEGVGIVRYLAIGTGIGAAVFGAAVAVAGMPDNEFMKISGSAPVFEAGMVATLIGMAALVGGADEANRILNQKIAELKGDYPGQPEKN